MLIKSYKFVVILILAGVFSILFLTYLRESSYFKKLDNLADSNPIVFLLSLMSLKIVGIIWPPIPGGIFTLAAIPFIGWWQAYLADLVGSTIGSSIAFILGKRWGYKFLSKLFDSNVISKIHNVEIVKGKEIEAVAFLRIFSGSLFAEAICYGAGLLKIKFRSFFIGSILAHIGIGIPTFYFAGSLFGSTNIMFGAILLIVSAIVLFIFRNRYFAMSHSIQKP